jgi:hypothetical protein
MNPNLFIEETRGDLLMCPIFKGIIYTMTMNVSGRRGGFLIWRARRTSNKS